MNEIIAAAGSFIRAGIISAGAGLVTNGWMTGDDLNTAAGLAVGAVGLVASIVRNRFLKKKLEA